MIFGDLVCSVRGYHKWEPKKQGHWCKTCKSWNGVDFWGELNRKFDQHLIKGIPKPTKKEKKK